MLMASMRDAYAGVGMLAASQLAQLNQLNQLSHLSHHHLMMQGQSPQPAAHPAQPRSPPQLHQQMQQPHQNTPPPQHGPVSPMSPMIPPECHSPPISRTYTYKKVTKPLLERKRRARINRCLDELKELMVGALEAEGENVSKLEKADILELTVRHLQRITRPRDAVEDANRFQAGFSQCASEACHFLLGLPGLDAGVGRRLVAHLSQVVSGLRAYSPPASPMSTPSGLLMTVPGTSSARSPPPEVSSTTCSRGVKREAEDSAGEVDLAVDVEGQDVPVNYTSEALEQQRKLSLSKRPRLNQQTCASSCGSSDEDEHGPMWRPW